VDRESTDAASPAITIVICTLNGSERLERCLAALGHQTIAQPFQLIVVDDGSTDDSGAIAEEHGAEVIRHSINRGVAAARNSGLAAARAPVIAFLDDDCVADPHWAESLLGGFTGGVVGIGGTALPSSEGGYLGGYLERNNPLVPLEIDLAANAGLLYRFARYLGRNRSEPPTGTRPVYSVATANAAFRVESIVGLGGFDERFRSGEDLDLCLRIGDAYPGALRFEPTAVVRHYFDADFRTLLRRNRSYGTGAARVYWKRDDIPPTVFPFPFLVIGLLAWSRRRPWRWIFALALPQLLYANGLRAIVRHRKLAPVFDCYVTLAEEANLNIGFARGVWLSRVQDDSRTVTASDQRGARTVSENVTPQA
jgi:glycosyltransferase involved in cell wall biosynthesis